MKVRVDRVLDGAAYATLADRKEKAEAPITAEREAEKPTRKPAAKKVEAQAPEAEAPAAEEPDAVEPAGEVEAEEQKPKKKTRRGSRGGRGRKKKTAAPASAENGTGDSEEIAPVAKIHVPAPDLGEEEPEPIADAATSEDGSEPAKPKKKTRRGTRGGRNRRRKTAATAEADGGEPQQEQVDTQSADTEGWGYVPMSEWADDVLSDE